MSAGQYRICVDKDLCQGHGVCAAEAPELFAVTDQGQIYDTVELRVEVISEAQLPLAQRAERFCPNGVIRIEAVEE
jgi:sterol 14-demethylase